jgi:hypothetical protein
MNRRNVCSDTLLSFELMCVKGQLKKTEPRDTRGFIAAFVLTEGKGGGAEMLCAVFQILGLRSQL